MRRYFTQGALVVAEFSFGTRLPAFGQEFAKSHAGCFQPPLQRPNVDPDAGGHGDERRALLFFLEKLDHYPDNDRLDVALREISVPGRPARYLHLLPHVTTPRCHAIGAR